MEFIIDLFLKTSGQVWNTLSADWYLLVASVGVAAWMNVYMDQEKVATFLRRHQRSGVFAATATAVGTPLCSCGTTAVILGMMASRMSWAPVVAFMVASPLTSPQELLYSAGLFGWPFALTFFAGSIVLGLAGGFVAQLWESWGWLNNQARFKPIAGGSEVESSALATRSSANTSSIKARALLEQVWLSGRKLLVFFLVFAYLGYLLNNLIPTAWVSALFGAGHTYSVPLAGLLGLPLYLNTEASLPLVRGLLDAGMSPGAALAFLITGAGTSIGAIAGVLTIARWRVVGLVIGTLLAGAIVIGFAYDGLMLLGVL